MLADRIKKGQLVLADEQAPVQVAAASQHDSDVRLGSHRNC